METYESCAKCGNFVREGLMDHEGTAICYYCEAPLEIVMRPAYTQRVIMVNGKTTYKEVDGKVIFDRREVEK